MATFSQWKASLRSSRVYWVHGAEPILVSEVVSDIKNLVSAGPLDGYTYWGSETSISQLLDILCQQPLFDESPRLVVVKDAHALESFDFLEEFLTLRTELPRVHLVLESSLSDIPDGMARFLRKIQVVKCSSPNTEDLVKLVQRWSGASSESSRNLVNWASGNVIAAWHMSQKIRLLRLPVNAPLTLTVFRSIDAEVLVTFAEALVAADKPKASILAQQVAYSEISGLCALLEIKLEQIEDILAHIRSGGSLRTFRGVPGVSYVVVESLAPSVSHYDSARIRRCRTLLALVDAEGRSGAAIGLLEALVALW